MKKIDKNLIIGVIRSATHKAGKQIEQGKLVTANQFEKMLEQQNKYNHLFFWVERLTIISGRAEFGNPRVEIVCTAQGYFFKSCFMMVKPHGKFDNQKPFAQYFNVEEIDT
ncbi:hypothetical protein CLV33_103173 [Jejuia pallidilutea]|uniref:Uncharacterized protein n=1 Tax=Jejuia pallidilutea TaxID=504487 RepID=A0A362X4L0_9FLAO|nr:hypothetical protein [Jejuia pallidilutea]PQV49539.1 hypothetical protein CLV33_103173 [Jejuia pallidilutea]